MVRKNIRRIMSNTHWKLRRKGMSYKQAFNTVRNKAIPLKVKYPYKNYDKDNKVNRFDCEPKNKWKQDATEEYLNESNNPELEKKYYKDIDSIDTETEKQLNRSLAGIKSIKTRADKKDLYLGFDSKKGSTFDDSYLNNRSNQKKSIAIRKVLRHSKSLSDSPFKEHWQEHLNELTEKRKKALEEYKKAKNEGLWISDKHEDYIQAKKNESQALNQYRRRLNKPDMLT